MKWHQMIGTKLNYPKAPLPVPKIADLCQLKCLDNFITLDIVKAHWLQLNNLCRHLKNLLLFHQPETDRFSRRYLCSRNNLSLKRLWKLTCQLYSQRWLKLTNQWTLLMPRETCIDDISNYRPRRNLNDSNQNWRIYAPFKIDEL